MKSHPLFFEFFNGTLTILLMCATFVFVRYLWKNRSAGYEELRPLIAILVLIVGGLINRWVLWIFQVMKSHEYDMDRMYLSMIYIFSGLVFAAGILCVLRVFSPNRWGHKNWFVPLIISLGGAAIILYL